MGDRQENTTVNEGSVEQEFRISNSDSNLAVDEKLVNMKTLERCFNEKIDREIGKIVDTLEDRIQNAILTAIYSIVTPKLNQLLGHKTRLLNQMRPVSWGVQNVENTYGLLPLLKTYPTVIIHYMCLIQMMRLEILYQTR